MSENNACRTCRFCVDNHPHNCLKSVNVRQSIEMQKNALALGNCSEWGGREVKPTRVGIDSNGNVYPKYPRFY